MKVFGKLTLIGAAMIAFGLATFSASAEDMEIVLNAPPAGKGPGSGGGGSGDGGGGNTASPTWYDWMAGDVDGAWKDADGNYSYLGQGVTITVVDDFNSGDIFDGNLTGTIETLHHGEWTSKQAGLIAPEATIKLDDFSRGGAVKLAGGFNVINLSYGMFTTAGYSVDQLLWGRQEASIMDYANSGGAFIAKSAGNEASDMGAYVWDGGSNRYVQDYLSLGLKDGLSVIFVGALDNNGSLDMAWYSNTAGEVTEFQSRFLVVGVEAGTQAEWAANDCVNTVGTCLWGTSFAAPIVAGYGAVLASKFDTATPQQVADRLLATADKSGAGYNLTIHGQGEACLSCAIAPDTLQ